MNETRYKRKRNIEHRFVCVSNREKQREMTPSVVCDKKKKMSFLPHLFGENNEEKPARLRKSKLFRFLIYIYVDRLGKNKTGSTSEV